MDYLFFLEIIFTFFTPYYNTQNILELSHKNIFKNYIFSKWFWIDSFSILPFDYFFDFDNNYSVFLKIWKLPRFYKLFKIARLIKSLQRKKRGNSCFVKISNLLANKSSVLQLVPVFMFIFIMCHCAACMWHFFGFWDNGHQSWISRNKYRDEPVYDRYVASMYFVFQTITTVGYGDIGVQTQIEFGLAIFLMFVGVLFYSNILSELLGLINRKLMEREEILSRIFLLRSISKNIKVPNTIMRDMIRVINSELAAEI